MNHIKMKNTPLINVLANEFEIFYLIQIFFKKYSKIKKKSDFFMEQTRFNVIDKHLS